jgi:pimeloyl-ACP methyl ester carboxylesterase
LVAALRELYRKFGCGDEPINVIAHSQGAAVTMNALAGGMTLSNFVMLGGTIEIDNRQSMADVNEMARNVGSAQRYYSPEDGATYWIGANSHWPRQITEFIWTRGTSGTYVNVPHSTRLARNVVQHRLYADHSDFLTPELARRAYANNVRTGTKSECCTQKNPAFAKALAELLGKFARPATKMEGGVLFKRIRHAPQQAPGTVGSVRNAFSTDPGWGGALGGRSPALD